MHLKRLGTVMPPLSEVKFYDSRNHEINYYKITPYSDGLMLSWSGTTVEFEANPKLWREKRSST